MRLASTTRFHTRRGFTIVELLVALALSMLVMAVITVAFREGLATLSLLKSTGDLADRLRTGENGLRQDLESYHFATNEDFSDQDSPGYMLLSDLRYDQAGYTKPANFGGYLRIVQGGNIVEGSDADNISSSRAVGDSIAFTVVRSGKTPADLFTDSTGAQSRFAEVLWALKPTANIGGVQTYSLFRYVRLLRDPRYPATAAFPTMQTVATTSRLTTTSLPDADAIVLTNVLSFEIKPTWVPATGTASPRTTIGLSAAVYLNGDAPFDSMPPFTGAVYDTATSTNMRIMGIQVKFRLYEPKNKVTRQSSIIVKM